MDDPVLDHLRQHGHRSRLVLLLHGGGRVVHPNAAVSITNSTLTGNAANGASGGDNGAGGALETCCSGGSATLLNDTLDGNSASGGTDAGGNIAGDEGAHTVSAENTIIAGGTANAGSNCDATSTVTSLGHDLESADSCALTGMGDQINIGPMLGSLADNGGPTQTMALLTGSPAIDAGSAASACPAIDQRGDPRPASGQLNCDVGAYELQEPNPPSYALTVALTGSGQGTVTSSDGTINCGSICTHNYARGTIVTLSATPASGATFAGWSGGGCSGTGTCAVTMDSGQIETATFIAGAPPPSSGGTASSPHRLAVSLRGTGSGAVTSTPAGITCPGTCAADFAQGTAVTLKASPAAGAAFTGWDGVGCSGGGTCVVTMDADHAVGATFTAAAAGPSCSLVTHGARIFAAGKHRKQKKHKKHRPFGVLDLAVHCDQPVSVTLTGKVTATVKIKHRTGKKRTRTQAFTTRTIRATATAGRTWVVTVKLPRAALSALKAKARESVRFALSATDANGTAQATATIRRLRLVRT